MEANQGGMSNLPTTDRKPTQKTAPRTLSPEARSERPNGQEEGELSFVAITQHLREGHDLVAATLLSAGLFEVALSTNTLDDVLAFELLFQAAQGALNWLTFTDFDFDGHVV